MAHAPTNNVVPSVTRCYCTCSRHCWGLNWSPVDNYLAVASLPTAVQAASSKPSRVFASCVDISPESSQSRSISSAAAASKSEIRRSFQTRRAATVPSLSTPKINQSEENKRYGSSTMPIVATICSWTSGSSRPLGNLWVAVRVRGGAMAKNCDKASRCNRTPHKLRSRQLPSSQ